MHVYAPGKHDYQVIAVKLDPQPWLKVAPTSYPPSEIYHFKELDEKVETYGKPFKLVQDVTVLNTAAAKKALGRRADQVERPARISGVRRQGVLRADEDAGQLRSHGEMIRVQPCGERCAALICVVRWPRRSLPISLQRPVRHQRRAAARRRQASASTSPARRASCASRSVSLQRLGMGFGADGPARRVESELRLSWEPSPDNPTPTEARTMRQVLRVNGSAPRKKDYENCTTPEQQDSEEQPLSIAAAGVSAESYTFTYGGRDVVDRPRRDRDRVPRDQEADRRRLARRGQRGLHQLRHRRRHARPDLDRCRNARCAAARSIAHRPDRNPAAAQSARAAAARSPGRWSGGIRRFVSSAVDVPGSGGDAGPAGCVVHSAGHARRRHAAPSHHQRSTCPIAAS